MLSARPDCDNPGRPLVEIAYEYLLFRYLVKPLDCGRRVETDSVRDLHEFDDVDAALPGLEQGHVGLIAAQFLGDLHLREAGSLALFDDELDQRAMSR
jgi:hypothetical protein